MARTDGSGRHRPKSYTDDFKRDAVRLVTEQRYSIAAAAKAVGVSDPTMRQWMAKFAPPIPECGPDATVDELRDENKRLKAALKRAELEREILKKATAFFARESP
jgi:transposase